MSAAQGTVYPFQEDDHQAAYIFNPLEDAEPTSRPAKRRKEDSDDDRVPHVSDHDAAGTSFEALLNGTETVQPLRRRQELYEASWSRIETRIQQVLREANQSTLEEVNHFVQEAVNQTNRDKIPAGFITAGPNIASQNLLFEQLSETLHDACQGRFVRISSAEAPNLKATLKKIIREATSRASGDDEVAEVAVGQDGRKFLDYDLEALHTFIQSSPPRRVIVTFEDSEAFDSALLSDLINLFYSWRDRIHWTLLFGIATSVELFQARLLKSACRHLYGGQFDVVQTAAILDSIVKSTVAAADTTLTIGPFLMRSMVERQTDQVAGIPVFVSSLKYAYMCHFYANPLCVLVHGDSGLDPKLLQPEHLEAVRGLTSFRRRVEVLVEAADTQVARRLLQDDGFLTEQVLQATQQRQVWLSKTLRSVQLLYATGLWTGEFTQRYVDVLAEGVNFTDEDSALADYIRRMDPNEVLNLIQQALEAVRSGNPDLALPGWEHEAPDLTTTLRELQTSIQTLSDSASATGRPLRSKYSAQSKVLRTTVVAQKVQLSRDSSALTDEDKQFTSLVDRLTQVLAAAATCAPVEDVFLHEAWLYDGRLPHRDVFVPRPGAVFQRALGRPHDYLACACCKGEAAATLPATAVLYRLYLETGSLVNVADLWSAFYGVVGKQEDDEEGDGQAQDSAVQSDAETGYDERTALVLFYRALAELKAMGFVRASRKKADHVAKLKWM